MLKLEGAIIIECSRCSGELSISDGIREKNSRKIGDGKTEKEKNRRKTGDVANFGNIELTLDS